MSIFLKIYSILLVNANRRIEYSRATLDGMQQDGYDVTHGVTRAPCDLIVLFTRSDRNRSDLSSEECFVYSGIFAKELEGVDFRPPVCNRTFNPESYEVNGTTENLLVHVRDHDLATALEGKNCSGTKYSAYHDRKCKRCALTRRDFKILRNCSLAFPDRIYEPRSCETEKLREETEILHLSEGLHFVDKVLTGISIAALSLHLIVFCLLFEHRNLPGYNLASLTVSLFIYYCVRIIGHTKEVSNRTCAVFVFLRLYFFLVSMFWMNVMAFDVWRALQLATTKLHVTSGKINLSKFFLYALYAWGLPLLFVSGALIVRLLKNVPDEYKLHISSDQYCGLYTKKLLIIYYASPVFTMIVINGVFFASITCIVVNNSVSKESDNGFSVARRNFLLYVRLCVIMGMTWLIGVIGVFADSVVLLKVAVILNGSYGQFIFIFFTCNPRVWKSLREKIRHFQSQKSTPSSSCLPQRSERSLSIYTP